MSRSDVQAFGEEVGISEASHYRLPVFLPFCIMHLSLLPHLGGGGSVDQQASETVIQERSDCSDGEQPQNCESLVLPVLQAKERHIHPTERQIGVKLFMCVMHACYG